MTLAVVAERNPIAPEEAQRALLHYGGLNLFGAPNYRFVWGYQRGVWVAGVFNFKYDDLERWHLERWASPELYGTPVEWYEIAYQPNPDGTWTNVLGEYPSEGQYERIITFQHARTKEPIRPSWDLAAEAVVRNQQHRSRAGGVIAKQIADDMERKKVETDRRKVEIMGEHEAAFPFKHWIPVSGPQTPETRRRPEWSPAN